MINTTPITPRELIKVLAICAQNELSVMLWGSPGVGKTTIVENFSRTILKGPCVDLRLPGRDPTELRGLQVPDLKNLVTTNLVPECLPQVKGPGTLFLDELTGATQDIQISAYSLLLERRIGKWKVPDGWFIIAAGNQVEDGAVYHEMGTALSDRLVHFKVVADLASWLDWYLQPDLGYPTEIASFLRLNSHRLDGNVEQVRQGHLIGPSPRSWERVAKVMKSIGPNAKKDGSFKIIAPGIVGEQVAAEFFLALEDMESADAAIDIMRENEPKKRQKMLPKKLAGIYNLIFALTALCRTKEDYIRGIEILNDMDTLADEGLPIGEAKTFGIEVMLDKARAASLRMFDQVTSSSTYLQFKEGRTRFTDAA